MELKVLRRAAYLLGGQSLADHSDSPASSSPQPPHIVSPSDAQLGDLLSSIASFDDRQLLVKVAF